MKKLIILLIIATSCREHRKAISTFNEPLIKAGPSDSSFEMKFGKIDTIEIDKKTQCNITTCSFLLHKKDLDSARLCYVANIETSTINNMTHRDATCPQSTVIVEGFLYESLEDFQQKNWLSKHTIAPANYGGVSVVNRSGVAYKRYLEKAKLLKGN